jgi:hypothetical protein
MAKAELRQLKAGQPVPKLVQTLSKECASFHQLLRKTSGAETATETANGAKTARLKKEIAERTKKHGCNTVIAPHSANATFTLPGRF